MRRGTDASRGRRSGRADLRRSRRARCLLELHRRRGRPRAVVVASSTRSSDTKASTFRAFPYSEGTMFASHTIRFAAGAVTLVAALYAGRTVAAQTPPAPPPAGGPATAAAAP